MPTVLHFILPELLIVGITATLALLEILLPESSRNLGKWVNLLGVIFVGAALIRLFGHTGTAFQGMFISDSFAVFFKLIFLGSAAVVLLMAHDSQSLNEAPEFRLILWSALLGMFFLVSSKDFLIFFIALELLTLSLYILAAYSYRDLRSIEAGLKYLVLGSLASAFLLYGISLLYAASGTLSFDGLAKVVRVDPQISPLFLAGALLVISALGFKVASVPFHVWVPDVYQGAPTPVVAFFSVASKSAGFAALLRIVLGILGPLEAKWQVLFSLSAALTLFYGNLGALVQKDMKRLLGYSSIGHAGFLLIALAAFKLQASISLLYYLLAYALTNLSAFLVVFAVEQAEGSHEIEAFRGLAHRSPLLAAGMFLAFLSLAGVPPLGGFFAKFFILLSAAKSGILWIVFVGAVNVAISLYYYLAVIRVVYFEKPRKDTPISLSLPLTLLLFVLMAGIVLIGIWQAPFFHFASRAANSLV